MSRSYVCKKIRLVILILQKNSNLCWLCTGLWWSSIWSDVMEHVVPFWLLLFCTNTFRKIRPLAIFFFFFLWSWTTLCYHRHGHKHQTNRNPCYFLFPACSVWNSSLWFTGTWHTTWALAGKSLFSEQCATTEVILEQGQKNNRSSDFKIHADTVAVDLKKSNSEFWLNKKFSGNVLTQLIF